MAKKTAATALHQHWIHSHEEDTETENVYRPASYNFPPSRGRKSFDIRSDGQVVEHGIGPTDRDVEAIGTWKLQDNGSTLAFYPKGSAKPARVMHIASVDKKRLVLKR
jgi:hypothetical protein